MWAGYNSAGNCLSETHRVQGLILNTAWIRYGSTCLYLFTVELQGEGFMRVGDQDKEKTQSLSVIVHLGDFWLERQQCVKGGAAFPGCFRAPVATVDHKPPAGVMGRESQCPRHHEIVKGIPKEGWNGLHVPLWAPDVTEKRSEDASQKNPKLTSKDSSCTSLL